MCPRSRAGKAGVIAAKRSSHLQYISSLFYDFCVFSHTADRQVVIAEVDALIAGKWETIQAPANNPPLIRVRLSGGQCVARA